MNSLVLPHGVEEIFAEARLAQLQAGVAVDHEAAVLADQPVADAAADAEGFAHEVLLRVAAHADLAGQVVQRRVETAFAPSPSLPSPVTVAVPTGTAVKPIFRIH